MSLLAGSTFAILSFGVPPRFRPKSFALIAQTLAFVPLALIRPALSLGLRDPVRAAFRAAATSPVSLAVCVIALGLPSVPFAMLGADVVRAHPSFVSVLAFQVASLAFAVVNCVWFETTTLLLLARKTGRLSLAGRRTSSRRSAVATGPGVKATPGLRTVARNSARNDANPPDGG